MSLQIGYASLCVSVTAVSIRIVVLTLAAPSPIMHPQMGFSCTGLAMWIVSAAYWFTEQNRKGFCIFTPWNERYKYSEIYMCMHMRAYVEEYVSVNSQGKSCLSQPCGMRDWDMKMLSIDVRYSVVWVLVTSASECRFCALGIGNHWSSLVSVLCSNFTQAWPNHYSECH